MTNQDPLADDFFTPVENTKPYFKAAIEGFAGSGKTYTAAKLAIGLHQKIQSQKPVVFFDTERAAGFLKPLFAEAGIQLLVRESKSFADLKETMKRLREGFADILIIDSISHIWEGYTEAYKNKPTQYGKAPKTRLEFQDWGIIKPLWKREFSDPFVQDPYHIIMCGRAGFEYENERNEETGKREIFKSGIKMKVEGETAYEPDILILMERLQEMDGSSIKRVIRQATIIKDRSTKLDGKVFENPTFEHFEPAINVILANPTKVDAAPELDTSTMFRTEEDKYEYRRKISIILENIEGELLRAWPSTSAAEKQAKLDALEKAFSTRSWTQISEATSLETLEKGFEVIKQLVTEAIQEKMKIPGADTPAEPKEEPKAEPKEESPLRKAVKKTSEAKFAE